MKDEVHTFLERSRPVAIGAGDDPLGTALSLPTLRQIFLG
jgi:hypothetical protein